MRLSPGLLASVALLTMTPLAAHANSFSVTFDPNITTDISALSLVKAIDFNAGFGTISFDNNLAAGTYDLSSLNNFALSFSFSDGNSYTQADIATPISEVLVVLTGTTGSENLFFSNKKDFGSGPYEGSLDLVSGSGSFLTFEPPGYRGIGIGQPGADLYNENGNFFSTYSAVEVSSVPLPASAPMFGAALLALAGFSYGMTRWVAPKSKKAAATA